MASFKAILLLLVLGGFSPKVHSQELKSVYEYFKDDGIQSGLEMNDKKFWLNGKEITITSGEIHYFRIHPDYWRDRLRKLRAMGANAVATYVAWNFHEPHRDVFDFGDGGNDFSAFANIRKFLQIAQEEDLLVLFRPGPYICAEWEWGGFPSWLARDPNLKVREYNQPFLDRVEIFMDRLLAEVEDLKFTNGGSIITIQIENEYSIMEPKDVRYLEFIRDNYLKNGFDDCVMHTCDGGGWESYSGAIPGVMQAANGDPDGSYPSLMEIQPDLPLLTTEFYTGWMTHWEEPGKANRDPEDFLENLEKIYAKYNASVNFYMYIGGTNFGFMNGVNTGRSPPYPYVMSFTETSYDYDAILSEAGDYATHYDRIADLLDKYANPRLRKPEKPAETKKSAYGRVEFKKYLTYNDIIDRIPSSHKVKAERAISMENLPINDNNGQSYGYIIYRILGNRNQGDKLKVSWPRDFAQLIIDEVQVQAAYENGEYWINSIKEFILNQTTDANPRLDIFIENMGRVNFAEAYELKQEKGIASIYDAKIEINDKEVEEIEIFALEFTGDWVRSLDNWRDTENSAELESPVLLMGTFFVDGEPGDTFVDTRGWQKGIILINGFNIGRFWAVGPQQTLYVPAPLLKSGENTIIFFEQIQPASYISLRTTPLLGDNN